MVPNPALVAYELNVSFWSDGAQKQRWFVLPEGQEIKFSDQGSWLFPAGTVFVKTFELPVDERHPQQRRRLETRLLVRDDHGGVYGAVYKWRPDNSDADLLPGALTESIRIRRRGGDREQSWYYPSREDCLACHTSLAGGVLGVNTRQTNRTSATGASNQLLAWSRLGLFNESVDAARLSSLPALARSDDLGRSLSDRARSYLDVNCSQCHRPGGTVAGFDARFETPLERQRLVNGPVLIDEGIDHARIVAPHDPWRSILYLRINTLEDFRMPPLARNVIDQSGVKLLSQWIESLPGRAVVAPPKIAPAGGSYSGPVKVRLSAEHGASIRYTIDGTVPTADDPLYRGPFTLSRSAIVRARAFAPDATNSIVAQEVFVVGP